MEAGVDFSNGGSLRRVVGKRFGKVPCRDRVFLSRRGGFGGCGREGRILLYLVEGGVKVRWEGSISGGEGRSGGEALYPIAE